MDTIGDTVSAGIDNDNVGTLNRRDMLDRMATVGAGVGAMTASGLIVPRSALADVSEVETAPVVATPAVPTVKLGGSSLEVSKTIQGYWQLAGGHGRYRETDAISNMEAHVKAGITTLDTADIYGPSELIVGKFMKDHPTAIPCTKFCCFRYLEEIDRDEVKLRIQKVRV